MRDERFNSRNRTAKEQGEKDKDTRTRIIELLKEKPMTQREIARALGKADATIKHHLDNLMKLGIVEKSEERLFKLSENYLNKKKIIEKAIVDICIEHKRTKFKKEDLAKLIYKKLPDVFENENEVLEHVREFILDISHENDIKLLLILDGINPKTFKKYKSGDKVVYNASIEDKHYLLCGYCGLPFNMKVFLKKVVENLRSSKEESKSKKIKKGLSGWKLDRFKEDQLRKYLISLLNPKETIYALDLLSRLGYYSEPDYYYYNDIIIDVYDEFVLLDYYYKVVYPAVALTRFSVEELKELKDYKPPEDRLKMVSKFIEKMKIKKMKIIGEDDTIDTIVDYIAQINACDDTEAILKWLVKHHDEIYNRSAEILHQLALKFFTIKWCDIANEDIVEERLNEKDEIYEEALGLYKKLMDDDWHLGLGGKCVCIYHEDYGLLHPYCYKLFLESKKNRNE